MLAQRFTQQSIWRLATQQPSTFSRSSLSKIFIPASGTISNRRIQSRHAATQTQQAQIGLKPDDAYQILVKQRLNRPVSPHLSIYQPQITWYGSALNRVTGTALSGGFYLFGISYLVAPLLGWHLESATLAASFGSLPFLAKFGIKYMVALPFTFHSFNGIRHLVWDTGREFSNKQVQRTGWTVVGLSIVSSGILAYM